MSYLAYHFRRNQWVRMASWTPPLGGPPLLSSILLQDIPLWLPCRLLMVPCFCVILVLICPKLCAVRQCLFLSLHAQPHPPNQSMPSSLTISTYALVRSALFQCVQFSDSNPHCVKILNSVCFFSVVFPYFRYVAWVSVWAWVSADKVNVHVSLFCSFDGVVCSRW